jgi:hypothetical protein
VGIEDSKTGWVRFDQLNRSANWSTPWLYDAEVPAGSPTRDKSFRQVRSASVKSELIAGRSRLADLQANVAPSPHVADTRGLLSHTTRAQVFPKKRWPYANAKLLGPNRQVLGGIGVDRLIRSSMHRQVSLLVPFYILITDRDK